MRFSFLHLQLNRTLTPLYREGLSSGRGADSKIARTAVLFSRAMSTKINPPLKGKDFFNRTREVEALTLDLKDAPRLSIVSGPVDSGKSALMLHLLDSLVKSEGRPILYLNLREGGFSSVKDFERFLERELGGWVKQVKELASRLKINISIDPVSINAELKEDAETTIGKLSTLLRLTGSALPEWSLWTGQQIPILFIDEANRMRNLLDDPDGHKALDNLFEWFVTNTKENGRFHVVLGSSDSFFHLWVQAFVGSSRFSKVVIGNLGKSEAERYWNEALIKRAALLEKLPPPSFQEAYEVCGGNMLYINRYLQQYARSKGEMKSGNFDLVSTEYARLVNASHVSPSPTGLVTSPIAGAKTPPLWNRQQLIETMQKLTTAQGNFLIYDKLCKELSKKIVDSFIDHNLLHLRPTGDLAYDLEGAPSNKAVLTAETPASLFAMKLFLEERKERKGID